MKRHLFKFLLSLVKALVIIKRLTVWLAQATGRFFVWLLRPAIPLIIAPLYQIIRRQWRRYLELSENPWKRRWLFISSEPSVILLGSLAVFFLTFGSVRASSAPGVITGSHSVLLTKIITSNEADWQADDNAGIVGGSEFTEQIPTTMYRNGGSVAYVFPYTGAVGPAPAGEPVTDEKPAPAQQVSPIQRYAVQRGDTLARIAKKFSIKIETLLWANNLVATSVLRPGDSLTVPSVDGIIYTVKSGGTLSDVAKKYSITTAKIAAANNVSATSQLKKGQTLVLPGIRPPAPAKVAVAPVIPASDPEPAPEPEQPSAPLDVVPLTPEPAQTRADVIPRPALAVGEKLLWPTRRHSITQYYSGGHPGLDIDGDYTDPIYAVDGGTVTFSGWNNSGYGNMILIDHGNGMVTRYAHSSKVFVAVGQQVNRGDVISMVGTTGRSTGSHLHFELIVRGKRVNPLKYIR